MERRDDFRIYIVAIVFGAAALVAVVAGALLTTGTVNGQTWAAALALGLFASLATTLDVAVQSRVGLSGNAMLLIAALVVFREDQQYIGVVVVALLGSIDYVQVRAKQLYKVAINAGIDSVALLIGALAFWTLIPSDSTGALALLAGVVVGAAVYFLVHSVMLALPIAIATAEPYAASLVDLLKFNLSAFPFAILGLGLGWVYLELGIAVIPLLVVPILIARRTYASYLELKASQEQTIETLILALEAKDRYTAGHAQRVAQFSEYMGAQMEFSPRRMERLRYAALMHDIGKLIVPNQLLNKPGRLTEAEFERVKQHEWVSVELLRRIDFLAPIAGDTTTEAATAAVGDTALVEPAIIHVADAFDAMTSTRSYRRALSQDIAFDELRKGAGSQFNASCVDALILAISTRGEHYGDGHEVDEEEWAVAPPEAGTGSAGLGDFLSEEQAAS